MGVRHRRAAVIAGPEDNRTAVTIKEVLVTGLKDHGLLPFPVISSSYQIDSGASAVRAILSAQQKPTVIFCGSDLIAMGAMSTLEHAGIEVPEDISVIGIDDISFAFLARPPLTTIRVPREHLGAVAFEALYKMLKLKRRKRADHYVETELSASPPARLADSIREIRVRIVNEISEPSSLAAALPKPPET